MFITNLMIPFKLFQIFNDDDLIWKKMTYSIK